ncbi:MAG: response regulator [Gammaproteobacteria bacterium]|jgi:CheY-like chemotaxis protein
MSSDKKFAANKATDSVAGLRFLVVDDHKFSRHITIEALKWLNATKIDEAQDASEAIALLQGAASMDRKSIASNALAKRLELSDDRLFGQGKFDCVITDFNMSPLNGLHLLKAIRTGDAKCARDTPVLMLTGFSDDYLIASALNLDVNAFVLKPISRVAFNEKLGRVLMRPVEPQDAEVYRSVEIPECDDLNNLPNDSDNGPEEETKPDDESIVVDEFANRPIRSVKLADISNMEEDEKLILGEDLVLGEDVEGPNGNILIHRGTRLTGLLVEKLNELNEIGMMPGEIKIYR